MNCRGSNLDVQFHITRVVQAQCSHFWEMEYLLARAARTYYMHLNLNFGFDMNMKTYIKIENNWFNTLFQEYNQPRQTFFIFEGINTYTPHFSVNQTMFTESHNVFIFKFNLHNMEGLTATASDSSSSSSSSSASASLLWPKHLPKPPMPRRGPRSKSSRLTLFSRSRQSCRLVLLLKSFRQRQWQREQQKE